MKIVGPNAFANALTGDLSYVQRSYAVTAREGNECSSFRPRILRDWVLNPCVAESRIFREIRVRKLHPLLEGRRAGERASCYGCAFSRLLRPVVARGRAESKGGTGRRSTRSTQSCPVYRSGSFPRGVWICGDALVGANGTPILWGRQ